MIVRPLMGGRTSSTGAAAGMEIDRFLPSGRCSDASRTR
jgi:hypothetical protein